MSKNKRQANKKQAVAANDTKAPATVQAAQPEKKQAVAANDTKVPATVQAVQPENKQTVTARRSSYPFGDLVAYAAASAGIPRSYAHKAIKAFLDEAKQLIAQGHSVNFSQFGSFDARMVHAKQIVTPQGKTIQTQDRVRVRFHNSTKMNELMDAVGTKALEKQGFTPTFKATLPTENGKVKENTPLDSTEAELDQILETQDFDV